MARLANAVFQFWRYLFLRQMDFFPDFLGQTLSERHVINGDCLHCDDLGAKDVVVHIVVVHNADRVGDEFAVVSDETSSVGGEGQAEGIFKRRRLLNDVRFQKRTNAIRPRRPADSNALRTRMTSKWSRITRNSRESSEEKCGNRL
jgi:hypothetical protein